MAWIALFVATLGGFLFGFSTGIISGAGPFIQLTFELSSLQQGAVISVLLLAATIGACLSGNVADRWGRKKGLLFSAWLYLLGITLSASAFYLSLFILGRFLTGLALGISSYLVPLYIGEISTAIHRGKQVIVNSLMITGGMLFAYGINWLFYQGEQWHLMFAIGIIPSGLFLTGILILPESPRWYLSKGKIALAKEALSKLGSGITIRQLILMHQVHCKQQQASWRSLLQPRIRNVVFVAIVLSIFQQATGINAILYYTPVLFKSSGFELNKIQMQATVYVGAINFIFTVLALWLVDWLGRRRLLIGGFILMSTTLLLVSLSQGIVVLIGVLLFVATFAMSIGCLFWLIITEIFPSSIRARAMSLATAVNWLSNFLITFAFLPVVDKIGINTCFFIFSLVSICGAAFSYFYIPETKSISLETIEENLWAGNSLRKLGQT